MYSGDNDARERGKTMTIFNLSQSLPEVCLCMPSEVRARVIEFRMLQFTIQGLGLDCLYEIESRQRQQLLLMRITCLTHVMLFTSPQ